MAKKFLVPIDLNQQEIQNAAIQLLGSDPGTPVNGQVWINSTTWHLKIRLNDTTVTLGRLDQISAPTANVAFGGNRITNLADGIASTDAATVGQLSALQTGMTWKNPVRAATTAPGTLASSFENGDTIDGITLATGDRILIKDQADASQNGIYVVNATGVPTRATDADTSAEVPPAMVVAVEEGDTHADTLWILTTNGPIDLGTTNLTFAKIPISVASYEAGTGLTESPAGTFNIDTSVVVRKTAPTTIGDGSTTQFDIAHNFGTRAAQVVVWRNTSPWEEVEVEVQRPDPDTIRLIFANAPTSAQFQAMVWA